MQTFFKSALLAVLASGAALQANDFSDLMKVSRETWSGKRHIGVICHYGASASQVQALAEAAGAGFHITVADIRRGEYAAHAANLLNLRQADYLVLMPKDPLVRDGSFAATVAVQTLSRRGVPSVGTSPAALGQGAVFAVGPRTGGELLVNERPIGTIDVILPDRFAFRRALSRMLAPAPAAVSFLALR